MTFDQNRCRTVTALDITTVKPETTVTVIKTQAPDPTCTGKPVANAFRDTPLQLRPGACVVYRIEATNRSDAPIRNVSISETISPYTSTSGTVQPANPCVAPPTRASGGSVVFLQADGKAICGTLAQLPPNGVLTMTFAVRINEK